MANDDDPFCQCGYRQSVHPTPPGCPFKFKRSVAFNMAIGDDDFWESAQLFRDNTMDANKAKKRRK
jgi:hypothetical protein